MTKPAFFRTPEATRLLERAARAAAPVAVHYLNDGNEGACAANTGGCAACKAVDALPGGHAACRDSRLQHAKEALRKGYAETFVCHMGFMCVSSPVFERGKSGFVMTVGPFNPSESPELMAQEARARYAELGGDDEEYPLPLDAVRTAPADGVNEIVEWTIESLRALPVDDLPEEEPVEAKPARRRKSIQAPVADAFDAQAIARSLIAGDSARARTLTAAAIGEAKRGKADPMTVARPRTVAVVAAVLEAAAALGVDTARAQDKWKRLLPAAVDRAETREDLLNAAMRILGAVGRSARAARRESPLTKLDAYIVPRLGEGVTVAQVAAHLGVDPSAVSHRLRRNFGMTFTEYLGRLRVDQAKDLFRRTRLNVREVSQRVGVDDASNFARLFRKYEQMTPGEYRRRFGK